MVTQEVFRCLGDPIRRSVLEMLALSRLTVTEIASHFEISRPAVSRHLRVLRQGGVVAETRSGRERIYRLEPEALERAAEWLRSVAAGRAEGQLGPGEPEAAAPEAQADAPEPDEGADWRSW